MNHVRAPEFWQKIIGQLEEKLQLGLLEQMKVVREVTFSGGELVLKVTTPEAHEFFNAHVNQQRLIILARPIIGIERVTVEFDPTEEIA